MTPTVFGDPRIPVTVLTGYLGSGKTTLLNRILSGNHGLRIAVIENEFGEVGIDHELVVGADEEIFEMNNGCLCCTVRGDLVRILNDLLQRTGRLDHIVIETTGLADPGPVVRTFFEEPSIRLKLRLDGVVTLVDARHIGEHWDSAPEVRPQAAFADLILLNKLDLVPTDTAEPIERMLRGANPNAPIRRVRFAETDIAELLRLGGYVLANGVDEPAFAASAHQNGHRHSDIASVGIEEECDLDVLKVDRWLGELLRTRSRDIYRSKGVLSIKGEPRRFVFQSVHSYFDGAAERYWSGEPRRNRMVFIGRHLDRDELTSGLRACAA
jgi:G3E family GTPase